MDVSSEEDKTNVELLLVRPRGAEIRYVLVDGPIAWGPFTAKELGVELVRFGRIGRRLGIELRRLVVHYPVWDEEVKPDETK